MIPGGGYLLYTSLYDVAAGSSRRSRMGRKLSTKYTTRRRSREKHVKGRWKWVHTVAGIKNVLKKYGNSFFSVAC